MVAAAPDVDAVFNQYIDRVKQGTQTDLSKTSYTDPRFKMQVNLEADAARFATFREAQKARELAGVKTDLDKAKIEKRYKEYLATEKHAIFANSAAAERWAGFAENADLYPNLEWRTAGDSDVRPEHDKLDGIILPMNDPFWNAHTPPLDWGCRCEIIQTDEPANQGNEKYKGFEETTTPKGFDFNPGIEHKLFSDTAGYYTSPSDAEYRQLSDSSQKLALAYFEKNVVKAMKTTVVKSKQVEMNFDEMGIKQTAMVNPGENRTLAVNAIYDIKNIVKKAKHTTTTEAGKTLHVWKTKDFEIEAHETGVNKAIFDFLKMLNHGK